MTELIASEIVDKKNLNLCLGKLMTQFLVNFYDFFKQKTKAKTYSQYLHSFRYFLEVFRKKPEVFD